MNNTDLIFSDTDYSDKQNWLRFCEKPDKKADIFVVYPTVVFTSNEAENPFVTLNNPKMRISAEKWLTQIDDVISQGNIFVPIYRQLNGSILTKYPARKMSEMTNQIPRDDIFTAFDYYLREINKNERPFILLGHSQGSQLAMELVTTFLGSEKYKDFNKNHIITYATGLPISQNEILKNSNLKFCEKKDDLCVIASWNCATKSEADTKRYENFISWKDNVLVNNPVSWKNDEKPVNLFISSIDLPQKIIEINSDVVVKADNSRGILLVSADETKFPATSSVVSKFHTSEILFFANSIKQNIKDRIAAFF